MKIAELNNKLKDNYIVLLPKEDNDIKESVEFNFNNVIYLDYTPTTDDVKSIIDYVNNKGEQLIIFDYDEVYRQILPYIRKTKKIKWIIKDSLAGITNSATRAVFTNLMEFCDRNIVNTIGCLDQGAYLVLKNAGYNAKFISLDIKRKKSTIKKSNSIGLIGNDENPNYNTYNQLSALKLVEYSYAKILKNMPATNHFIKFFGIKEKECNSLEEVISNNYVNLYCNFTFTNKELIIKSMDNGVPCLLGNCDIFDNFPSLKKYLVLDSDDDISEIANKINSIKESKDKIIKDYEKFRLKYTENSKKTINKFLELK